MENQTTIVHKPEVFSISSILAVVSAILSFSTGAILGMFFAFLAIFLGVVGVVTALSPSRRGGIASTMAVGAGLVGIVAALIKGLMWIL